MRHPLSRRASLLAVLAVVLIAAAGCATEPNQASPAETTTTLGETSTSQAATEQSTSTTQASGTDPDETTSSATFVVDGRTITVELAFCMVSPDGEALLHGPGTEVGTDVTGYFDGDTVPHEGTITGEFRFDIGASGQFESSDEFLAMGDAFGTLDMTPQGDGWLVIGPAWSDDGTDLGEATVEFSC